MLNKVSLSMKKIHKEATATEKKSKEEKGTASRVARGFGFDVRASRRCLRSTFISLPQITIVQTQSAAVTR